MGVAENSGSPKSSILIGFSIIDHPFWGTTIFGNTLMDILKRWFLFRDNLSISHVMSYSTSIFMGGIDLCKASMFFRLFFPTSFHFTFAENSGLLSAVTFHGASWHPLGTLRCNKGCFVFLVCLVWCFKSSRYHTPQKRGKLNPTTFKHDIGKIDTVLNLQIVFFLGGSYAQRWLRTACKIHLKGNDSTCRRENLNNTSTKPKPPVRHPMDWHTFSPANR